MLILGVETSCDETGLALYDADAGGLLAHAVHSQIAMHEAYGGVVPELASRDHLRRLVPLSREVFACSGRRVGELAAVAYTQGPGLAGALLAGAAFARGLAHVLAVPSIGIHHLEGHLLSPLLSTRAPAFPFVALLVSGGHTQLMHVHEVGRYELLGETQDDAAGEAFDKTAKLLGLGYPGGPALSKLAESGKQGRYRLPRPMIASGDLEFSFSGLKTAVLTLLRKEMPVSHADLARAFVDAVVEVLVAKCGLAMERTGLTQLVVAGGVGANSQLRAALDARAGESGFDVYYPEPELCTDNGAMIAFAAALRMRAGKPASAGSGFSVRPRWDQLNSQKKLLCALDSFRPAQDEIELPKDFTKVVVTVAESNVSGLRRPQERRKALYVCVGLFFLFVIGGETQALFGSVSTIAEQFAAVGSFAVHFIYEVTVGVTVILRSLSNQLVFNSAVSLFLAAVVFLISLLTLSRLVIRNNRA